jgi:hypothetical protein
LSRGLSCFAPPFPWILADAGAIFDPGRIAMHLPGQHNKGNEFSKLVWWLLGIIMLFLTWQFIQSLYTSSRIEKRLKQTVETIKKQ